MNFRIIAIIAAAFIVSAAGLVDAQTHNAHRRRAAPSTTTGSDAALAIQVLLDRAHFSPGQIDGTLGTNTIQAAQAFARARGLPPTTDPTALFDALGGRTIEPLATYEITEKDAEGPFTDVIPKDLMEQSKLPALGYTSILEAISEQFHASPTLLKRLNPGIEFRAGAKVRVPHITSSTDEPGAGNVTVTVSQSASSLTVTDANGQILLYAPVTSGSEHDPLPLGRWTVTSVLRNPTFNYNPDLFWDANPAHTKAKIPAGPNGPVGVVWIGLDKEHYGIHGTPEPSLIGRTQSHGCVRLTNWDATRLAGLVQKGTPVVFEE